MSNLKFKNSLTNTPIVGKPKLGLRKRVFDAENKIIGSVSGNKIYDLNNRLWGTIVTKDNVSGYNKNDIVGHGDVIGTFDKGKNIYVKRRSITTLDVMPIEYMGTIRSNKFAAVILPLLIALFGAISVTGAIIAAIIGNNNDYLKYAPVLSVMNYSDSVAWVQDGQLPIFYSSQYNTDKFIAPGDSGEFRFVIKNDNKHKIRYTITLKESNENNFSLKYRLKCDTYVIGPEDYVVIEEITIPSDVLKPVESKLYRLFWRWDPDVDDEADTINGQEQRRYKIEINIVAEYI